MNNFISIVNNFNLVIFTDKKSFKYIDIKNNPRIKIIVKPFEFFFNYKYKDLWIENHKNNFFLNEKSMHNADWKINMLWSEKVWFVHETAKNKYFDTEFYGWCDIGYFRNEKDHLELSQLSNWPNNAKIENCDKNKIHYACTNNANGYMRFIEKAVKAKNAIGLPMVPIPPHQESVAGGFFILHKTKIDWWAITYNSKLELYLKNNYLVKDDQIIIIDCIFTQPDKFLLHREKNCKYDNWFLFQRLLS